MTTPAVLVMSEAMSVIRRTSTVGADGRPVVTEVSEPCTGAFKHRMTIDNFDAGVVTSNEVTVYVYTGALPEVGDVMVIRGERFESVGIAHPMVSRATNVVHHHEVRVRRTER